MTRTNSSRVLRILVLPIALCVGCDKTDEMMIGAVLPLTGDSAIYGTAIQRGIDLAVEQLPGADSPENPGFTVTVRTEDSGSDPQQAAARLGDVYAAGATAAIGGVTSEEALAMVPVADQTGNILLSPTASSPRLSGISQNFFRIFPSATDEANTIARHMLDAQQVTTIAVVYQDDAFGQGVNESMEEAYSGTIAGAIPFAVGDSDLSDVVSQVKELEAGAETSEEEEGFGIYVAAIGDELIRAIKALRQGGVDARIFTTSAIASPEVLDALGEFGERVFFTQTVFDISGAEEPMASFARAYEAKYGQPADFYAAHGYDAVMVLVEARQEAGSSLSSEMLKGMRALSNLPATTGSIQFRETNDVQKFPRVSLVFNGEVTDYEEFMANRREMLRERREELERRMRELERRMENPG
ncbi:MAG TPA: ABC transporter substrate-binding protein [Thermoanaerobaculia bacterium]|nr:ABC transporter substrate-binding protein [Thermoanaerobaculia bacterium]